MLLAIDIGNTNTVIGLFDGEQLRFIARAQTNSHKTDAEYAVMLKDILSLYGYSVESVTGACISSVVPAMKKPFERAIRLFCDVPVLTVGSGMKTGLNIKIDNPAELGTDLVCSAVAAIAKHSCPLIVFDLGTATKISAVDKEKNFVGVSIMPGIQISLNALSSVAAQLPHISLEAPPSVIGKNTIDSMRSGMVLGTAAMMDGMIRRFKAELGQNLTVLVTGGLSPEIVPHCEETVIGDQNLVLEGLRILYHKNRK